MDPQVTMGFAQKWTWLIRSRLRGCKRASATAASNTLVTVGPHCKSAGGHQKIRCAMLFFYVGMWYGLFWAMTHDRGPMLPLLFRKRMSTKQNMCS